MGSELAALGRVQAPLKQCAEDGHVNGAPIERGGVAQLGHFHDGERGHLHLLEQTAVEPGYVVIAIQATLAHDGEQVGQACGEFVAGEVLVVHQPFKHAPGQQAHVFGKKAEQALREEVGHLVGMRLPALRVSVSGGATSAQAIGQGGKAFGGGFGDVAAGLFGAKTLGVGPQAAQQGLFFRLRHLVQQHGVHF